MSIATAIQNAQQKVAAAYTAVSNKGGTLPATQDLSNLPTAINSIQGGGTDNLPAFVSSGVSTFTDNTITKIRPYAFYNDNSTYSTTPITSVSCQNVTELGENAFRPCEQLANVYLPNLEVTGSYSLAYTSIVTVSFPKLTSIGSSTFAYAASLTTISLSNSVTTIGTSAFEFCSNLEGSFSFPGIIHGGRMGGIFRECFKVSQIEFPNLTDVMSFASAFTTTAISSMTFPSLSSLSNSRNFFNAFNNCPALTSISFPALTSTSFGPYTDQFNSMLSGVTGCTVHFPSNLQSVIGSWSDVTAGFGGTNTTVLFDLTATT